MRSKILVAAVLAVTGCASTSTQVVQPKDKAEAAYIDGLKNFANANYLEAQRIFGDVVKMPAYLQVTKLARIRLADTLFAQSKYEQAVQVYQSFIRRHAGAADVTYARFRVAEAHFKMVPSEFWLLPPVYEMDLSSVERARYYLEAFIRRFPTSDLIAVAQTLRDECLALQLAQHRYVIDFYRGRKKPMGVIFRSHELMRRFPVRGHGRNDYLHLAQAYRELRWRRRELELRTVVTRRWPKAKDQALHLQRVASLRNEITRLRAEGKKDAEMPVEGPPTIKERPEMLCGPDGARSRPTLTK
ncbi:MAG TPA: hypothetical protein DCQ06_10360 [Myxococcales bacterium]|nr:hypothetical protein [Myxococcales bacterium]HAN31988.1 hypothetical protein [Myxococcales bacterium]|tara:strand:- start:177 stop:1079 length:903 start_codon:yes stop_codon:yes gene_type:complete